MREIKFRFWNKDENRFQYNLLESKETYQNPFGREDLITCQYTGLKDKNGKEIAEGDIVKDKFELLYEVRFGEFADTKYHVQYGFYLYDFADKINRGNMGYDADESCPLEVIGNIYENS